VPALQRGPASKLDPRNASPPTADLMSVFTKVTSEELERWLRQYRVGTLRELKGIAAGIENTNYFVTTSQGRFVLTLFEKLTARELPFYLNLMAHLAASGIPSPRPIPDCRDQLLGELNGKPATLVSFLSGRDLEHPTAAHCRDVGSLLARIHLAGLSFGMPMANPRGPHWWRKVMPEIVPFMKAEDAALLRAEVEFQATYRYADLPRGAIHADLFRDNVLFDDDQVAGVIDFYFACTDALLYDVAIAANDWCITGNGRLDGARAEALLSGYGDVRPYTEVERDDWAVMLRAAALRFWVSRLYDYHLPRQGELTHAKDPDHFRNILKAHIAQEARLPHRVA
jgi:homoserine kinase type II